MPDHMQCLDVIISALNLDLNKVLQDKSELFPDEDRLLTDEVQEIIYSYIEDTSAEDDISNLLRSATEMPPSYQSFLRDNYTTPDDLMRHLACLYVYDEVNRRANAQLTS